MIEIIISYFKAIAEGTTLFSKVYGLCDLVANNTEGYPAEFNDGNYHPVEFSEDKSLVYFRKNGPVQWEDLDSVIGGKSQKKMILPLRVIAKAAKENFGNDQFSNDVMALALIRRMNFNNPSDLKAATQASYIESISVTYETNRDVIIKEELNGNGDNTDYEFIYVSLDFQVIVTGNPECFYNTCGDPASNCWEVPICRQIPTEIEVQQIRDNLAAETAVRIAEDTSLSNGLSAEITTRESADTTLQSNIDSKENSITEGTTSQYWRGDKTWQTLDKSTIGLENVPDVDATNPSNITQDATHRFVADSDISTWNGKEDSITAGTTSQYWRGDKTWQTLDKTTVGLGNVLNVDATNPANITQDSTHRFASDSEKSTWNAKQNALGYTPENSANKETVSLSTSSTNYPASGVIKSYVDSGLSGKENAFSKNTAFNLNFGTGTSNIAAIGSTLQALQTVETDSNGKLVTAVKLSAYNKAYGIISDTVCQGNDVRLSDSRNPKLYSYSHNTVTAPTDTTEDILASILIPANTLGVNDTIFLTWLTAMSGTSNAKTLRVRLNTSASIGGTVYGLQAYTLTNGSAQGLTRISMKNSNSAQEGANLNLFYGSVTGTTTTSSYNITSDMYLIISVQKITAGDVFTLNNYDVEIKKP